MFIIIHKICKIDFLLGNPLSFHTSFLQSVWNFSVYTLFLTQLQIATWVVARTFRWHIAGVHGKKKRKTRIPAVRLHWHPSRVLFLSVAGLVIRSGSFSVGILAKIQEVGITATPPAQRGSVIEPRLMRTRQICRRQWQKVVELWNRGSHGKKRRS